MSLQTTVSKSDQTDEGYDEQRFELPSSLEGWSDEQKAELAYQLLLCIPISKTIKVVERLSPLLHRDIISSLPNEISVQILSYLDINSLVNVSRVSKKWKLQTEDQSIWRHLFVKAGWGFDTQEIDHYLAYSEKKPRRTNIPSSSYTIARTNDTIYDPTLLPTMPGAPARLKPFKKPGDLFFSKLRARQTPNPNNNMSSNNNNSVTLKPTLVYSSKSQPILPSTHVVERPFMNRPSPRRYVKYDETAQYHYIESNDRRFINWKRLYQNRRLIEKRWQNGKYKTKSFPSDEHTQDIHQGAIYCLQFNNNILVSGSRDRTLKIWNIKTGTCQHTLQGHSGSVLCLQFNDQYLISGSSDANLIIWDINTGERLRTLKGHNESVLNVKFLDNTIVSCSKDRTIRIWNLETGQLERTLVGHRAAVNAVQFKGNRIVSASGDRTIKIWDRNTGECLRTLDSHSRGIACVEYDGEYIVSGSSDQTIKVWSAHTGECLHTLGGHSELVRTLQLNSEAKRIVSGSYDGNLKIWGLQNGACSGTISQPALGRILNLQFDFGRIICCSNLGKIVMYDFTHSIDSRFLM